jgi:antitoxin component of MazEF toxin-antitoxin module
VCAPAAQRPLGPKALAEAIGFRKGEEVQRSLEREALVLRRITRKR